MPATKRSSFRLPEDVMSKLNTLARAWGGIEPMQKTRALIETINRCYAAEARKTENAEKKFSKKSADVS